MLKTKKETQLRKREEDGDEKVGKGGILEKNDNG